MHSDEGFMRLHQLLPIECVTLRCSQFVLSLTCPNDKVIDAIIENMGGQLTLAPSLGRMNRFHNICHVCTCMNHVTF